MANQKEKIFAFHYKTTDPEKLHKFIDDCGSNKQGRNKYLYWTRFLPNFYTLATLEDTYWDVNKLTKAIYDHMEKNISFVIFEIENTPAQGRMPEDFWNAWKNSQDLTGHFKNMKRVKKLKKIIAYTNKKAELEEKERELERRRAELKKALSLKKREDELKVKEKELEEMEKLLHDEPDTITETPTKRRKRWGWRS